MISKEQQDVVAGLGGQLPSTPVRLAEFDGQRMAVVLHKAGKRIILRGTASFVRDDTVGNTLKIWLEDDEPGQPVLMLSEVEWNGRIVPDFHFGCDFCLVIG